MILRVNLSNGRQVKMEALFYVVQNWENGKWNNHSVYPMSKYKEAEDVMNTLEFEARVEIWN